MALIDDIIQKEWTPTDEIDVRTSKPRLEFTPRGKPSTSLAALIKSGFVDDMKAKIDIFANARGISPDRYDVKGGDIVYQDDDGKWYPETPDTIMSKAKRFVGENVARAPAGLAASAAVATGHPLLAPLAAGGAEQVRQQIGKRVFGGKKDIVSSLIDTALEGVFAGGGELAGHYLGKSFIGVKNRGAGALKYAVDQEIKDRLISPMDIVKAQYIEDLATKHGIKLAPHQIYDKEGMTNIWKYLRKHPRTSDAIRQFEDTLDDQVEKAMEQGLRQFSEVEDIAAVGKRAVGEASDIIEGAHKTRTKAVKPIYKKAFAEREILDVDELKNEMSRNLKNIEALEAARPKPDIDAMVSELEARGIPAFEMTKEGKRAYGERIASDYKRIIKKDVPVVGGKIDLEKVNELKKRNSDIKAAIVGKPPEGFVAKTKIVKVNTSAAEKEIDRLLDETIPKDPSYKALTDIKEMIQSAGGDLQKLDRVKKSGIDNILNSTGTSPTLGREMKLVKDKLVDAMDEESPLYSKARKVYQLLSPKVNELETSAIGRISRITEDKAAMKSVNEIFSQANTSPMLTRKARVYFEKRDPNLWNDMLGAWMRNQYEELKATQGGRAAVANVAGKMHQKLFGTQKQREILRASMDQIQYENLEGLMTVFKRAAVGTGGESMTMPFSEIQKQLQKNVGSTLLELGERPVKTLLDKTFAKWNDIVMSGRQGELLDALLDNQATKAIANMKSLKPGSEKLLKEIGAFIGIVGGREVERELQ